MLVEIKEIQEDFPFEKNDLGEGGEIDAK